MAEEDLSNGDELILQALYEDMQSMQSMGQKSALESSKSLSTILITGNAAAAAAALAFLGSTSIPDSTVQLIVSIVPVLMIGAAAGWLSAYFGMLATVRALKPVAELRSQLLSFFSGGNNRQELQASINKIAGPDILGIYLSGPYRILSFACGLISLLCFVGSAIFIAIRFPLISN